MRQDGVRPHVQLDGVTKAYPMPGQGAGAGAAAKRGDLRVLGPVDLSVPQGELFSVVGPSGCGKSTLMDILAGLTAPSAGSVLFEGQAVRGVPEGVGVVFQEDASFPWLTVRDNIAFGLERAGMNGAEVERRVAYALGFMGLHEFGQAYPAQLSGGMRQRVCIARTLVTQPRLILLDEPFGALDQQTRLLMGDEVLRLWRETHATIVLITHSLDEAAMLSDRVGVMSARPGRFIDIVRTDWSRDRTSDVVSAPQFGALQARLWKILRDESRRSLDWQVHGAQGAQTPGCAATEGAGSPAAGPKKGGDGAA